MVARPNRGADEVDERLLDEVVDYVNRRYAARGLELARELGEYLVDAFFGGDPDAFADEGTHASWRALAQRDDLAVPHTRLWYSVAILRQLRELGPIGESLGVSHHRRLLGVRDVDAKKALAKRAARERLTVQQLDRAVAAHYRRQSTPKRRGRPRLPGWVKALRRLPKLVEPLGDGVPSAEDVDDLGARRMREILENLEEPLERLIAARDAIRTALARVDG